MAHEWSHLLVACTRHIWEQVMFYLMAQVSREDMKQFPSGNIARAKYLPHIPLTVGLALDFIFGEHLYTAGEMSAKDDDVGPDVSYDIGNGICRCDIQEKGPGQHRVE